MNLRRRPTTPHDELAAWLATSGWPAAERDRLLEPAAAEALLSSPVPATLAAFLDALRRKAPEPAGSGDRRAG